VPSMMLCVWGCTSRPWQTPTPHVAAMVMRASISAMKSAGFTHMQEN